MSGTALITGGQRGIGLGIAQALGQAGFALALTAELPETAVEVQSALAALPAGTRYLRHDLADAAAAPALVAAAEAALGPLSTFVSNAGVPARRRGDLLEVAPGDFDWTLDINLRGAFFLAQAVARTMCARPAPHPRTMIFVTSVSAAMASPERAEYCISKAGAAMMAKCFALRLAEAGIAVFDLRPGIIATAMTDPARARHDARIAEGLVPARRWGQPGDIGASVVPLARGDFAFSSGAVIPVDGGLSIARL